MFGTLSFDEVAAVYVEQGTEAFERFSEMTVFDALIANDDRHLGNFGFLFDNRTRSLVSAIVSRRCAASSLLRTPTSRSTSGIRSF